MGDSGGLVITTEYPLLHGPYNSPAVGVGDFISCEIRGLQKVKTFTDAPIPQPIKTGRGHAILICGDLARAIKIESASAIAYWWGVSIHRVTIWRRALGVGRITDGTRELLAENANPELAQYAKAGNAASMEPASRKIRDASHSRALKERIARIGQAELERLSRLGRNGGRARQASMSAEQRAALAKLGGLAAGRRELFSQRASAVKRFRTKGDVFRYEKSRDRLVIDMRLAARSPTAIAKLLSEDTSSIRLLIYDLANRFPMFAGELMTAGQLARNRISSGDKTR